MDILNEPELKAGIYRHYKGAHYLVLGLGAMSSGKDEGKLAVTYVSLEGAHLPGPRMRVRLWDGDDGWDTPVLIDNGVVKRYIYVGQQVPK